MNKSLKSDINEYLHQIKKLLICPQTKKKNYLNELEMNIDEYLIENPESDINDIQEHFGTPADISDGFLSALNESELNNKIKKTKFIRLSVVIVGLFIVSIFAVVCYFEIFYNQKASNRRLEADISDTSSVSVHL